jgi:meiotically up-regulated gene 157 (Mug157) protein
MIEEKYGRDDHLDSAFTEALQLMTRLAKVEQRHDPASYRFLRANGVDHDSLSHDGYGAPVGYTGMVYSAFRPSDDACKFGYLVPANLFFQSELNQLNNRFKSKESRELEQEIIDGVNRFAITNGRYAYEVDGLGNSLFIDDANIPSLLSLPIVSSISVDDEIYQATRRSILSEENPYFFAGTKAIGIGSQHTPNNYVWPISLAVQAMTDNSIENRLAMLDVLESTDAGTGSMHESFDVNDDSQFTRGWFSWADMTYVSLVLSSVNYA